MKRRWKKKKRRRKLFEDLITDCPFLKGVKWITTIFIEPPTRVGIRTRKNEGFTIPGFGDPSPPLALHFGQVWRTHTHIYIHCSRVAFTVPYTPYTCIEIAIDFFFRPAATIDPRSLCKYKEYKERWTLHRAYARASYALLHPKG